MNKLKQSIIDFYLDWVNNFLTTQGLADHYDIEKETAEQLIAIGRDLHETHVENLKLTNGKYKY